MKCTGVAFPQQKIQPKLCVEMLIIAVSWLFQGLQISFLTQKLEYLSNTQIWALYLIYLKDCEEFRNGIYMGSSIRYQQVDT